MSIYSQTSKNPKITKRDKMSTLLSLIDTIIIFSCFFVLLVPSCCVDGNNIDLDIAIQDVMDIFNIRGSSIAFFDKNTMTEPIVGGYGKISSSEDSDNDVTVDTTTAFMTASVSKVFTGTAVLILIDQGFIISLDDDICDVIPNDWDRSACRNPNFPNTPVTWRMLVTHRSSLIEGVPFVVDSNTGEEVEASYGPEDGYNGLASGNPTCPLDDVIGFYRDILIDKETETSVGATLNINWYQIAQQQDGGAWNDYEPGSRHMYSNFAIGYIAALTELVTGQSFAEFCETNIFTPLQMDHTAWFRKDLPTDTLEAIPTEYRRKEGFVDVGHYCFIDYASGSLRTTTNDVIKFLNSMLDYGSPTLWDRTETGIQALSCQERNTDGNPVEGNDCENGVTWFLLDNSMKEKKRKLEFWLEPLLDLDWTDGAVHDGAEAGCQTQILVLPKAGVYISVLTNTDGNDDYAAQELAWEVFNVLGYSSAAVVLPIRNILSSSGIAWAMTALALTVYSFLL